MQTETSDDKLIRGVGVTGATALNMIDMIGVGPFITIPLIIAAMRIGLGRRCSVQYT